MARKKVRRSAKTYIKNGTYLSFDEQWQMIQMYQEEHRTITEISKKLESRR